MSLALAFLAGVVFASLLPDEFRLWVRDAAGKAREAVLGASPARVTGVGREAPDVTVSARRGIGFGRAARNVTGFAMGLIGWVLKHPWLAVGLIVLGLFLVFGAPSCSPFGKSKGELRLEREIAEAEARTQQQLNERDAVIAVIQQQTAVLRTQIRLESQRGHDEIAAATPEHEEPLDPQLVAAWRSSLDRLCVPRANGDRADSCG